MLRKAVAVISFMVAAALAPLPGTAAAAGKLDAIKARGKLLVGVTESSPPFSFRDDGRGIVGYDVDLARDVAKQLGVATETITIINADRIAALQQDRVDLVAVGMTRSKKRAADIDFSYAYLDSPHMILVRKDGGVAHITDLAGRKLALVRSASVDAKLKEAVPTLQIVYFDTYDAAFAALADRSVDAFLADKMLVLWFAQKSGHPADFSLIADYQLPRTAGFALKKNEPQFLTFVNRTLLDLEASGEAAKIFDKWFAPLPRTFRIKPD
ncbi:MAG TPA: transporter substrate-binding domain-containing protein [Xanthobacteraceae bacterium]|nr:transporter substrate-binding domain-containing protein [Xanthobacteraceae bacterium]